MFGVPQGSILGPIIFNIFINDLLLSIQECDICNFADDNTLYACDRNIENVFYRLSNEIEATLKWFKCNLMVANPAKFQVIFLGINDPNLGLNIDGKMVICSKEDKLLGIIIINSPSHLILNMSLCCSKATQKTRLFLELEMSRQRNFTIIFCFSDFLVISLMIITIKSVYFLCILNVNLDKNLRLDCQEVCVKKREK